jgi:hypothetical protein
MLLAHEQDMQFQHTQINRASFRSADEDVQVQYVKFMSTIPKMFNSKYVDVRNVPDLIFYSNNLRSIDDMVSAVRGYVWAQQEFDDAVQQVKNTPKSPEASSRLERLLPDWKDAFFDFPSRAYHQTYRSFTSRGSAKSWVVRSLNEVCTEGIRSGTVPDVIFHYLTF